MTVSPTSALVRAAGGLLDLVVPADCAACGDRAVPGVVVCAPCRADVGHARFRHVDGDVGPVLVAHDPPTWAAAEYGGALARLVVAHKDGARRDAADILAPLTASALTAALRAVAAAPAPRRPPRSILVVPAPSRAGAVRRRGDRPVSTLARAGVALVRSRPSSAPGAVVVDALRHTRTVADQSGLGRAQRRDNLRGALRVRRSRARVVAGADCIVVDDVTTSGATLAECTRALHRAGADLVVAAVVAATP